MTLRKKLIIAIVVLSLVLSVEVVGTLAWLSDKTDPVFNTFTYGDINIDLSETKTDFKMVPGNTIEKDPKVTVKAGSEKCYLFVKIDESANLGEYISYTVAEGWTQGDGTNIPTNVYYREAEAGETFSVLANDKVSVLNTVTKEMMNAIDGIVEQGQAATAEQELNLRPTLSFTAYAVQKANVSTPAAAWAIANPSMP